MFFQKKNLKKRELYSLFVLVYTIKNDRLQPQL